MRDRLLEAIGIQTEPKHVEKASRRERWKRQAWMIGCSLGSFFLVGWAGWQLLSLVDWHPTGTIAAFALLPMLLVAIGLSQWVFGWGVERFDLVVPWQFREERAKERDPDDRAQAYADPLPIGILIALIIGLLVLSRVIGQL